MDLPLTQILENHDLPVVEASQGDERRQVGILDVDSSVYPIYKGINKIGRHPSCDVTLSHSTVSKKHAQIEAGSHPGSIFVCDLKSSNGTKINDVILRPDCFYQLKHGDVLVLGTVEATYKDVERSEMSVIPETPRENLKASVVSARKPLVIPGTPDSSLNNSSLSEGDSATILGSQREEDVFRTPCQPPRRHVGSKPLHDPPFPAKENDRIKEHRDDTSLVVSTEPPDVNKAENQEVSIFDMETQRFSPNNRTNPGVDINGDDIHEAETQNFIVDKNESESSSRTEEASKREDFNEKNVERTEDFTTMVKNGKNKISETPTGKPETISEDAAKRESSAKENDRTKKDHDDMSLAVSTQQPDINEAKNRVVSIFDMETQRFSPNNRTNPGADAGGDDIHEAETQKFIVDENESESSSRTEEASKREDFNGKNAKRTEVFTTMAQNGKNRISETAGKLETTSEDSAKRESLDLSLSPNQTNLRIDDESDEDQRSEEPDESLEFFPSQNLLDGDIEAVLEKKETVVEPSKEKDIFDRETQYLETSDPQLIFNEPTQLLLAPTSNLPRLNVNTAATSADSDSETDEEGIFQESSVEMNSKQSCRKNDVVSDSDTDEEGIFAKLSPPQQGRPSNSKNTSTAEDDLFLAPTQMLDAHNERRVVSDRNASSLSSDDLGTRKGDKSVDNQRDLTMAPAKIVDRGGKNGRSIVADYDITTADTQVIPGAVNNANRRKSLSEDDDLAMAPTQLLERVEGSPDDDDDDDLSTAPTQVMIGKEKERISVPDDYDETTAPTQLLERMKGSSDNEGDDISMAPTQIMDRGGKNGRSIVANYDITTADTQVIPGIVNNANRRKSLSEDDDVAMAPTQLLERVEGSPDDDDDHDLSTAPTQVMIGKEKERISVPDDYDETTAPTQLLERTKGSSDDEGDNDISTAPTQTMTSERSSMIKVRKQIAKTKKTSSTGDIGHESGEIRLIGDLALKESRVTKNTDATDSSKSSMRGNTVCEEPNSNPLNDSIERKLNTMFDGVSETDMSELQRLSTQNLENILEQTDSEAAKDDQRGTRIVRSSSESLVQRDGKRNNRTKCPSPRSSTSRRKVIYAPGTSGFVDGQAIESDESIPALETPSKEDRVSRNREHPSDASEALGHREAVAEAKRHDCRILEIDTQDLLEGLPAINISRTRSSTASPATSRSSSPVNDRESPEPSTLTKVSRRSIIPKKRKLSLTKDRDEDRGDNSTPYVPANVASAKSVSSMSNSAEHRGVENFGGPQKSLPSSKRSRHGSQTDCSDKNAKFQNIVDDSDSDPEFDDMVRMSSRLLSVKSAYVQDHSNLNAQFRETRTRSKAHNCIWTDSDSDDGASSSIASKNSRKVTTTQAIRHSSKVDDVPPPSVLQTTIVDPAKKDYQSPQRVARTRRPNKRYIDAEDENIKPTAKKRKAKGKSSDDKTAPRRRGRPVVKDSYDEKDSETTSNDSSLARNIHPQTTATSSEGHCSSVVEAAVRSTTKSVDSQSETSQRKSKKLPRNIRATGCYLEKGDCESQNSTEANARMRSIEKTGVSTRNRTSTNPNADDYSNSAPGSDSQEIENILTHAQTATFSETNRVGCANDEDESTKIQSTEKRFNNSDDDDAQLERPKAKKARAVERPITAEPPGEALAVRSRRGRGTKVSADDFDDDTNGPNIRKPVKSNKRKNCGKGIKEKREQNEIAGSSNGSTADSRLEVSTLSNLSTPSKGREARSLSLSTSSSVSPSRTRCKVLFTGINETDFRSVVLQLGGTITEKPTNGAVLVTDKVRRTLKFLCSMALAVPIVSTDWLTESKKSDRFLDLEPYILRDSESEEKYGFDLVESFQRAREHKLLEGYTLLLTPNVAPPSIADLKSMIQASGGKPLLRAPSTWSENTVIVSREEDIANAKKFAAKAPRFVPVVSTEFILTGLLRQKLDFANYELKSVQVP